MPARRFIVTGRVQGVGFRAFVLRLAFTLGASGEAWNRRDGAVELVAEHEDAAVLDRLESGLVHGPGRVDSVQVEPAEERGYQGFDLGPSR